MVDFAAEGIPDVVVLGRYEYHSVKPGLSSHRHDDAIEICYLVRGRQTYRIEGREYRLVGGDIFVARLGVPHDTGGRPEDCGVLYWLILRIPEPQASILQLCPQDSSALRSRLLALPRLHFAGRPGLKQMFDRLFDLYDALADELKPVSPCRDLK